MIRVRTVFSGLTGSPYLSTMHFIGTGSTDAAAAVAAVGSFWSAIDALMWNSLTWQTEADVDEVDPAGNLTAIHGVTPETGAGGVIGTPLPFATQALVTWRTTAFLGGRNLRGRTFIPGLTTSALAAGQLEGTSQGTIQTAAGTLVAAAAQLGVWSKRYLAIHEAVSGSVAVKFAVLTSRRD